MKKFFLKKRYFFSTIFIVTIFVSCATYYQKNLKFQEYFRTGDLEKANIFLENDNSKKGKNRLLYLLNRGVVSWMLKDQNKSLNYFNEADKIIDEQNRNLAMEALTLISNPNIKPYKPEDFEIVMINYYKALNFLEIGKYKEAIVECKQINIKLNELNDKHKDHKNRYQRDAFANNLMGLIYDANGNYNDAFIAYRNALEVYEEDYEKNFNVKIPEQLKLDILRTAYLTGFQEELRFYEKKFNKKYKHKKKQSYLVFFWQTGLCPVKSEWSLNFTAIRGSGNLVTFYNSELDISFPYYVSNKKERNALGITRIAFPKYLERKPVFKNAEINVNGKNLILDESQNINNIAFKCLKDRMLREIGASLLRMATKKALEKLAAKEDEALGAALSIINAVTEKADTRNWQILPYAIHYTRINLKEGNNNLKFKAYGSYDNIYEKDFIFNGKKRKTDFFVFHNLQTYNIKN